MQKVLLLAVFFLQYYTFLGQNDSELTCIEGKNKALSDNSKGVLKTKILEKLRLSPNELDNPNLEFLRYYKLYIFSKYSIEAAYEGCLYSPYDDCYSRQMDSIIYLNFGKEIFLKTKTIAKNQYQKHQNSNKEKSKILNLQKVYANHLDRKPRFLGKIRVIEKIFKSEFSGLNDTHESIIVNLAISRDGTVIDYRIESNENLVGSKPEVIRDLNSLGNWIPGSIYGVMVNSMTQLIFD